VSFTVADQIGITGLQEAEKRGFVDAWGLAEAVNDSAHCCNVSRALLARLHLHHVDIRLRQHASGGGADDSKCLWQACGPCASSLLYVAAAVW
jgi:hypothetical protein